MKRQIIVGTHVIVDNDYCAVVVDFKDGLVGVEDQDENYFQVAHSSIELDESMEEGMYICPHYKEPVLPDDNGNCSLCGSSMTPEGDCTGVKNNPPLSQLVEYTELAKKLAIDIRGLVECIEYESKIITHLNIMIDEEDTADEVTINGFDIGTVHGVKSTETILKLIIDNKIETIKDWRKEMNDLKGRLTEVLGKIN